MFEFYDKLPWPIRAAIPNILIIFTIFYFHRTFHLNLMEFLGVTLCVIVTFYWIGLLCLFIYRNWLGVALGHSVDLKNCGSWGVVTGSTQGIGLAYAHALAKRGINVVLVSRSIEKLSEVAQEISETYKVLVKIISVDFTGGLEIYEDLEKQLADLDVGVLVNNVGMCYAYPEYFGDLPGGRKFCADLINCNISSVTIMTHIVLPSMVQRQKGVVINVGSISCLLDCPYLSLYGASKAFVDKFTQDLDLEYGPHGIIFQSLIPGYVVSAMSKIKQSTIWVPSADDFVERALNNVGIQKRSAVWLPHQILHFIVKVAHFFRRDGASSVSQFIGRQFWLYGKKVMIYRTKKSG